ncbi:MAG TPA: tRNA (adenosine(37)-N6)-threonylcarbamoyltransferase complex dimerization subunit type 1 TsaB, partial [Thermodesulfobacteriota bacterium]|nr:tRNA (adenosine(37)-N6)-threonylcarbamoyltransferase complex dimerization subunit type 1 TsaB [Thermodesulfobacteriota bacterium]
MKVLAIESSTPQAAVALVDGERLLAEMRVATRTGQAERLLPAIDRILGDSGVGLRDLEGLAVAMGPGSFTGLRIGLATVKGLAAALGLPVAGVPSLDALAWQVPWPAWPVVALLDARRGELYGARFEPDGRGGTRRASDDLALDLAGVEALVGAGPALLVG